MSDHRTLFLTQDFRPDRGGIARVYGELFDRIPQMHVSTVAAIHSSVEGDRRVHRMPFGFRGAHRPANILRWTRWAARFVRRNGIALVHVGNVRPLGYVAALLRRRLGIPYIVYVHGKDLLKEGRKGGSRWLVRAGTREILGNAEAIVANSAATASLARDLAFRVGRPDVADRTHVIHPGADPGRFRSTSSSLRPKHGDANWSPVLLSVARLVPRKGIDTVIQALPAILTIHPNATYVVVGCGPDLARLEQLARNTGVLRHVRFEGDVEDDQLPAIYERADLFLLPTREILADDEIEGFGIAYVEAAAAGVPSIGANVGGVPDAVLDGITGLLVPPDSPAAVATAALRVLGDRELRTRLGENGRATVERDLNWDRAAKEVRSVVSEVVTQSGRYGALMRTGSIISPQWIRMTASSRSTTGK